MKKERKIGGDRRQKQKYGGDVMRTKITLECTECKQRNYNMTKDKKNHPDRMETKKYCRFCKTHTLHKETK
jgi:large subunit ribosomal protein L33